MHKYVKALTARLTQDQHDYLWGCFGRAMWGEPKKMFLVMVYLADGGKSTIASAMGSATRYGNDLQNGYSRKVTGDVLKIVKDGKTGLNEEKAAIVESRIVFCDEAADLSITVASLKALAGGEGDTTTYQPKCGKERTMPILATRKSTPIRRRLPRIPHPSPPTPARQPRQFPRFSAGAAGVIPHRERQVVVWRGIMTDGPVWCAMPVSQEILDEIALTRAEYDLIVERIGREPNAVELGLFGALWSEHCGYKRCTILIMALARIREL